MRTHYERLECIDELPEIVEVQAPVMQLDGGDVLSEMKSAMMCADELLEAVGDTGVPFGWASVRRLCLRAVFLSSNDFDWIRQLADDLACTLKVVLAGVVVERRKQFDAQLMLDLDYHAMVFIIKSSGGIKS